MAQSSFHTILVIGDKPESLLIEYSLSTVVPKYLKVKRDDAKKLLNKHIKAIKSLLDNKNLKLTDNQKEYFKELYLSLQETDEFDYFLDITKGCIYDEETGDAYTTENNKAKYQMYYIGENLHFAEPFKTIDGEETYNSKIENIAWDEMHMNLKKVALCQRVWQLLVEKEDANDEAETKLIEAWTPRIDYFLNFSDCDEYVKHTCSFWHYGVIKRTEDGSIFNEVDYTISDKEWVSTFYDKYIKNLPPDTLLTICEVRKLDE